MPHEIKKYLFDIQQAIEQIETFLNGLHPSVCNFRLD